MTRGIGAVNAAAFVRTCRPLQRSGVAALASFADGGHRFSQSTAAADAENDDADVTAAQKLLRSAISDRATVRFFSDKPVPDATLAEVLRLTQRAPSGFNMQPYACVVVRDQAEREKFADAMLATNGRKVKEAPVVVVFAADLEPSRRVPHIQKMMYDNGANAAEINNLPHFVRLFSSEGQLAGGIRSLISTAVSPLQAIPANVPTIAWSYKQTVFAATTFLYAAQASGLATCPMEGFDEARVKNALDIPDRYSVPVVICCGYPKPGTECTNVTPRLAPTEIFFDGKFGRSTEKLFEE
uniref:Nitroreductase domain-containing protein n=1 Tax=Globisporangium ultimum (strain ATCC 200006 / CBS 805.95 / DAOM BR144) TaxID=431595 RepID=K3WSR0_GLOUD